MHRNINNAPDSSALQSAIARNGAGSPQNGTEGSPTGRILPNHDQKNPNPLYTPRKKHLNFYLVFSFVWMVFGCLCVYLVKRTEYDVEEKYKIAAQKQKNSESNAVWDAFFLHPDSVRPCVDDFPPQAYKRFPKP